MQFDEVVAGVYRIRDTCNVYLIESQLTGDGKRTGIAIDFGSGLVLEAAAQLGITLTDVLMTHHHRDQGQGLPSAVELGIRIHVPPVEIDLFRNVDEMWQGRQLSNDYNLRQDRFSLLDPVPVDFTAAEYRTVEVGGVGVSTIPTPGHTVGSVTYLVERAGRRLAFCGDLIHSPGKVWSMAATQWSYSNQEGAAMTVLSTMLLADEEPTDLLPSHGEPMTEAVAALGLLGDTMQEYVNSRRSDPWDLSARLRSPWVALTEHLLLNRSSLSCSYALLSSTGEALLIDFGYDMTTGLTLTSERAARRPWLASLPALKSQFGVSAVTVALPTHYHDDHVAGLPLLREVEGTRLWIPSTVAPVLANPMMFDLPCQWFEPITADRILSEGEPFDWNEYTITAHPQPGHTLFAVAYELEVDGVRVMFTGDQQEGMGVPGGRREFLNYQYRNRFELGDFQRSAALYRRISPGLMVSGHWEPRWVDAGYLELLAEDGRYADEIHERLLPRDEIAIGADGVVARIVPYRSRVTRGSRVRLVVEVLNPFFDARQVIVRLDTPVGWEADEPVVLGELAAGATGEWEFWVTAPTEPQRRARVAADVTIGDSLFGQQAEALLTAI